jgi:hypothetical protein
MITLTLFPSITIFTTILSLYSLDRQTKFSTALIIATLFTIFFGGIMIWYSQMLFFLIYFLNIICVIVLTPCLVYWINRMLPPIKDNNKYWLRILLIFIVSAALTLLLFVASMLLFISYNPTHVFPGR